MKHIFIIGLLLFAGSAYGQADSLRLPVDSTSTATPDDLGYQVFIGIKANDLQQVVNLAFTQAEMIQIKRIAKVPEVYIQKEISNANQEHPGETRVRVVKVPEDFAEIRRFWGRKLSAARLEWDQVSFVKCHYKIIAENNIEHTDILVQLKINNENLYIEIEATKTVAGQWKIIEDMTYKVNGEAFIESLKN
ncbi:hypothetical protein DNU06_15490 [Putridiphycobacter roseus]|uniref:DUF4468 domain-containing protein n=1 Tax=Putridiphycobacter roseus TaxID=2219161 RepID=A0A2W1MXL1_9FLAO|nr:hypothetical protein [Putridiphycobacter roseus]PZE15910.1 hypothetical protein DNU06_15490 [Putridiphycobacter roseus]